MYPPRERPTIDDMSTPQHPRSTTIDDPHSRHPGRHAHVVGLSAAALALAWWMSPVLGGVLTLAASLILAAALAPDRSFLDRHGVGGGCRNDIGWYL
jgi:hypothetical protein